MKSLVGTLFFFFPLTLLALDFPKNGFSIDALEAKSDLPSSQVVMMFLPPTDQFAPNVGVQVQNFSEGLEAYLTLSRSQFSAAGMKVIKEKKVSATKATLEYSGAMQGRNLHYYALAEKKGNQVYLVTATATETQWPKVKDALVKNVDSFKTK